MQTPYGAAYAMSTWNATFERYLTEQLQSSLGCTFKLVPLPTPDAAYLQMANNLTDFLLVNSGLMHCVQVSTAGRSRDRLALLSALLLSGDHLVSKFAILS